jgi:hypothetical protein
MSEITTRRPSSAGGDHVENHVHAPAVGLAPHHLDEILALVIDPARGAEPLADARLVRGSGRCEDARAECGRELDGRGADAAGAAVDQHGIARLAAAAVEEVGPDGEKSLRDCGRFD